MDPRIERRINGTGKNYNELTTDEKILHHVKSTNRCVIFFVVITCVALAAAGVAFCVSYIR